MKGFLKLTLVLVLLAALASCGQKAEATWQEQYDLGVKYLSEGSYEEAVLAFTAAIELDEKRPEAYIGRGDAYVGEAEQRAQDRDEAAAAYEKALDDFLNAIRLDAQSPEAYGKAAEVYTALGDMDAAREILEQGYEATGDDGLAQLEGAGSENQAGGESEPSAEAEAVSGTLSVSDVQYRYEEGGYMTEMNEDAVGGMELRFTVNGPETVRSVRIAAWSPEGFSEQAISEQIAFFEGVWGQETAAPGDGGSTLPMEENQGFPVYEEDRNSTVQVLLIGLDDGMKAVGYAVVTVAIP